MADEQPEVAHSHAYRRPTALEGLGARIGRLVPDGAVRRWLRAAYRAAVRLRTGGSVTAHLPGGEAVRLLPEYRFVTWNPAEYEAFRAAATPGAVALDVGANVGAYTLLLAQWVRPGGRVYAFEPAPEAFGGLSEHLRLNGLADTVVPVRAAVAATSGTATLATDGLSGANRLADAPGGETVQTVTLDEFCAREGIIPSFLKIDVEGAELDVLRGARETIAKAGAALALFVEMHPTIWREMGIAAEDVQAELARQGLRAEPLRPVADPWALEGECLRLVRE
ncbi:MAG: FkbM family methyltransferase [Gemmatimonadetes bacterium]|nr:FkbM family methyltransferase [Gemmatimonadota bacterium]